MPRETSWHVPTIFAYRVPDAHRDFNVVFLQRMSELEQKQVEQALESVDLEAAQQLNIPQIPAPRPLKVKKWIRDHFPTSANTLETAKAAYNKNYTSDLSFTTLAFVDSGWDLGNVIVAHWEQQGEGEEARLSAARVSMGIANMLLTACDRIEGMTLSHALGSDVYQRSKVDLYADIPDDDQSDTVEEPSEHTWPSHLPEGMAIGSRKPTIISLRNLGDDALSGLKATIGSGAEACYRDVQILNWEGPEPTSRLAIRDLYNQLQRNAGEKQGEQKAYIFFVDYMLQGLAGEPQILAVSGIERDPGKGVEVLPIFTTEFLAAWRAGTRGSSIENATELYDIWKKEHIDHLNTANSGDLMNACPVFFLHPFTPEQERQARAAVCALGDVETGEDWGHLFIWHGYICDDGKEHTLEDLRDLFESWDPHSPFYDKNKAGQYRLNAYPHHFVALDQKVLEPEDPQAWMASTLDFHGEDVSDQLGWTIGRIAPSETSITFMNLDIANMGPEECFEEETVDRLWLSDLKAYREDDWPRDREV